MRSIKTRYKLYQISDSSSLDLFGRFLLGSWESLLRGLLQSLAIVPFLVIALTSLVPFVLYSQGSSMPVGSHSLDKWYPSGRDYWRSLTITAYK